MEPRRRSVAHLALPLVLALILAACSSSSGDKGGEGGDGRITEGGVLRIGTSSGLTSLNPFVGFNQDDYAAWMYIYPSLLMYDTTKPMYDFLPGFATEWSQSADGMTVTFKTVPGATWSDGEPLNADDVVFTFEMIKAYEKGPTAQWAGSVTFLDTIEATDENTIVATYNQPAGTALFDLGLTPILPPQVWEQYATGDGKEIKRFPNEPVGGEPLVGGGPFILTEYKKNDIALFEANPTYYGTKPLVDGFGLQFFQDEDAMVTALKTDQLDAINEIPPTSVETLNAAGMEVYEGPALALRDLIFNVDPAKQQHRELLDPKVREAMEYAIDRQAIVDTAWLGFASPGSTIIPEGNATQGVEWHDPDIQPLPYDLDQANQILDSLGYTRGSDGIRVANGEPMEYELVFPLDEAGAGDRAFRIIQQGFEQIGVRLIQKRLDTNAAWNAMYSDEDGHYIFDLAMWDWFPAADPDFILAVLTCAQWANWNDTGYCSEQYDKLYDAQKSATDPKERQQIIFQMQEMAFNDRPYIILTYDTRLDAWSPNWTGFLESTQGIFNNFSTQSLTSVHQA
ncbi:MAG TPA: ABC transporter substrate-binding protein [Actinomycetota bacterium]|nr:ABC transporter substrate-binding protein [Actinomycetota bacterium]